MVDFGRNPGRPVRIRVSPGGHEILDLLAAVCTGEPGRRLVGLSGAPGSGKSTLARALASHVDLPVVPMDGFHLADIELRRRGLMAVKGAPQTFDAWGYAALLSRLAERPDHVIMAPTFDHGVGEPVAGAIPVPRDARCVLTEGNYLLLDETPWREVRRHLDTVWHLESPEEPRRLWLQARHRDRGLDPRDAAAWVEVVDDANAQRVAASSHRADVILDLRDWGWTLRGSPPGTSWRLDACEP